MKPELILMDKPRVVEHQGQRLAIVGGTRRRSPFEIRWWSFDLQGDIVILRRCWNSFVVSDSREIHRPCHREILPLIEQCRWQAAFELGVHHGEQVLETHAHNSLYAI